MPACQLQPLHVLLLKYMCVWRHTPPTHGPPKCCRLSPESPRDEGNVAAFLNPTEVPHFHPICSYMRVEANATHMVHQVRSSYDGSLMDEFVLTKPPGWRFQPRPASLDSGDEAADGSSSSGNSAGRGDSLGGAWARLVGRMGIDGAAAAVA